MEPDRDQPDLASGGSDSAGLDLRLPHPDADLGFGARDSSVLDTLGDAPEVIAPAPGPDGDTSPLAGATPDTEAIPDGYLRAADTTWGAPEDDAWYWLFQGYGTGTCGATSVAMVIADMMNMPLGSNQQVVEQAVTLGLLQYDPSNPDWQKWGGWSGMTTSNVEALLESYGVASTSYTGANVGHLASYLEAGHPIVVMVDGEEIWYGGDDDATDWGQAPNHFVQVVGVDYVQQVVYLNDPAIENGAGLAVSMSLFEDAWGDAGNTMIMTDQPLESAVPVGAGAVRGESATTPASAGLPEPDGSGTLLLGFTLHASGGTWIVPDRARR